MDSDRYLQALIKAKLPATQLQLIRNFIRAEALEAVHGPKENATRRLWRMDAAITPIVQANAERFRLNWLDRLHNWWRNN